MTTSSWLPPASAGRHRCWSPLARGREALVGGGNWRYTLRYEGECADGWGFRVVLAKLAVLEDGHPTGIITAFRYEPAPKYYP